MPYTRKVSRYKRGNQKS